MALHYRNLDETTRKLMTEEVNRDVDNNSLYPSKRFTHEGEQAWPSLLLEAIANNHDDAWIAQEIRSRGYMKAYEETARGTKKVPVNAPDVFAEGEFNRFYCRAVCVKAINDHLDSVIAYRAKEVEKPRPESAAKIRKAFNPAAILADLRANPGVDLALGIPSGPNSGLSLKLP